MRKALFFALVSMLISSCGQSHVVEIPDATNSDTSTLQPTSTETPLPTHTATPTLAPDLNVYECEDNVTPQDCDFVKTGVRMAREYLIANFGRDVTDGVNMIVVNAPYELPDEGAFRFPAGKSPFIKMNVGSPDWVEDATPEWQHRNVSWVVHEFTHFWQYNHGCLSLRTEADQDSLIRFINEGHAEYVSRMAVNSLELISQPLDFWWPQVGFDEDEWFSQYDVETMVVKQLVEQNGSMSFTRFCEEMAGGMEPGQAFETAFDVSVQDFREKFKREVLGSLGDCTPATCKAPKMGELGTYSIEDLFNPDDNTPTLYARFVDQNNEPVIISNAHLGRQESATAEGDWRQIPPDIVGVFSAPLPPGAYFFYFCEPGYPSNEYSESCTSYSTEDFHVVEGEATDITIKLPPDIENPDLGGPNLIVHFTDRDGNAISNLRVEICNIEDPKITVCGPIFPGRVTDVNGDLTAMLRTGTYELIFSWTADLNGKRQWYPMYELTGVKVEETETTAISYQMPRPNLNVKFLDAVGVPLKFHWLFLCKAGVEVGGCQESLTNAQGVFEVFVEPGEYYIQTCKAGGIIHANCYWFDPDITTPSFHVGSETETTVLEYELHKFK